MLFSFISSVCDSTLPLARFQYIKCNRAGSEWDGFFMFALGMSIVILCRLFVMFNFCVQGLLKRYLIPVFISWWRSHYILINRKLFPVIMVLFIQGVNLITSHPHYLEGEENFMYTSPFSTLDPQVPPS